MNIIRFSKTEIGRGVGRHERGISKLVTAAAGAASDYAANNTLSSLANNPEHCDLNISYNCYDGKIDTYL